MTVSIPLPRRAWFPRALEPIAETEPISVQEHLAVGDDAPVLPAMRYSWVERLGISVSILTGTGALIVTILGVLMLGGDA